MNSVTLFESSNCRIGLSITLAFLASAALTCAGVLRTCALFEEELLALLFVSSLGSSAPPIDPGPFFFVVGVFTIKLGYN